MLGAGGQSLPDPEYIGSVSDPQDPGSSYKLSSGGGGLDVFGISGVAVGDLVVIAFSFDHRSNTNYAYRQWAGMTITETQAGVGNTNPGFYLAYGFVQSGDTNPYLTSTSANYWKGMSAMASVFRGVTTLDESSWTTGSSGMPNTPTLGAGSRLYVRAGHLDDDVITSCSAPSGHNLANFATGIMGSYKSSTMIAYSFGGPTTGGQFGGNGSDYHAGTAMRFS